MDPLLVKPGSYPPLKREVVQNADLFSIPIYLDPFEVGDFFVGRGWVGGAGARTHCGRASQEKKNEGDGD